MENLNNQIGCGYCHLELTCKIRDPKVNKAKQGCPDWLHWEQSNKKDEILKHYKTK